MVESRRKLLTQREMADELGVCEKTIYRLLNTGELKYLWINGQRKVTRELWEHYLETHLASGALTEPETP